MQAPEDDESWLEMMKWPVCLENEKNEIVVEPLSSSSLYVWNQRSIVTRYIGLPGSLLVPGG